MSTSIKESRAHGALPDHRRRALLGALAGLGATAAGAWLLPGRALAAPGTPTAAPATVVEVVDLAGRTVRLPSQLKRIASAGGSPAVNAFLFLFGLGDRLINGLPPSFNNEAWRWQRFFAPRLGELPAVSGPPPAWTPNVEALLALQPDLAFVVSTVAADKLQALGLPAVVLNWDKNASINDTVRLLANITGEQQRADDYFAWARRLRSRVDNRLAHAGPPPRVLYCRWQGLTQPIMVPANQLIAAAGGSSVTAADNPLHLDVFPFSAEQLLAWQPQVILLASAEEIPLVYADSRFASLPAVRNRRVFAVPHGAHIWTHYTPEQPLGVLWLAQVLYPSRFAGVDLLVETRDFYQRFFGKSPGEAELRKLLHLV